MSILKIEGTGSAGAIAVTGAVPAGASYRLISVSVKLSTAPTTSENLTVTLDAAAGEEYDVALDTINPSSYTMTSLVFVPDQEIILVGGDEIDVAFANTDARQYGVVITFKRV